MRATAKLEADEERRRAPPVPRVRLGRAYAQSLAGTGVVVLMGVVSGVLTTRLLGAEGRGELTLLMLVPALTSRLGNCGLTQSVAYLESPTRRLRSLSAGSAMCLAALLGLAQCALLAPVLGMLLPALSGRQAPVAETCLIYIPITYVLYVLLGCDLADGDFGRYNLFQALPVVLYAATLALLWMAGLVSPASFALGNVGAWLVVLVLRLARSGRYVVRPDINVSRMWLILRQGWRFFVPELAGLALLRADTALLARMVSAEELGLYYVALAVAMGQAATANPIAQVCFRSTSSNSDLAASVSTLVRQFRIFQLVFVATAVLSMAAAPTVIRIAFGAEFLRSAISTYLLIGTMAAWSCSQLLDNGLRGFGYARFGTLSNTLGLASVLLVGPPLVRALGIKGMAAAACFGQCLSVFVKIALMKKEMGCPLSSWWGLSRSGVLELWACGRRHLNDVR
jgi:O-antigen/teichoic acid export membrane protein